MENIIFEDKNICRECGGFCCKKSGCDYSIEDFESLKVDYLQSILEQGDISIVSYQNFKLINGNLINEPFLYLRARNKNRPIVDLLSMKTTCASLLADGCKYELNKRPRGGVNLIPMSGERKCYPLENPFNIVNGWRPHQKTLAVLVKRLTGKGVNTILEEDIYKLFCDVKKGNFEGVSPIEKSDIISMMSMLKEAYPKIHDKAVADLSKKEYPLFVKKLTR